jgi:phage repressor protein C with HTH and peptisase S24 domain
MSEPVNPPLYDALVALKPEGWSLHKWMQEAGVSRQFFGDLKKKGSDPKGGTLEKVLGAIGYTPAQFYDESPIQPPRGRGNVLPFRAAGEHRDVPLVGTAQASEMEIDGDGEVRFVERMSLDLDNQVDYLRRPPSLATKRDVYAITVAGDSASPKYDDGEPAYVDPKRPPRSGDWVVVQLVKEEPEAEERRLHIALLKQFVRRTDSYVELHQLNPDVRFQVPNRQVHAIHRVIPWSEIVFF